MTSNSSAVSVSRHTVPHGTLGEPGLVWNTMNFQVFGGSSHVCWLTHASATSCVSTHMGLTE